MELKKTIKLRLTPLTKRDRAEARQLLRDYRVLVEEALQTVIANDARSKKRAHDLCYRVLRGKHHIYTTSLLWKRIRGRWRCTRAIESYLESGGRES